VIFLTALVLSTGICPTNTDFHSPHDATYAGAAALLSDGREVIVVVSSDQQLRVSWDGGQSWLTKVGAGLEAAHLWTLTYHPEMASQGGDGLFLTGGREGVWGFDPVTGNVATMNTGLPADDMWVMDLDAPLAGSNGPVIAVTEEGKVYLMDPNSLQWRFSLDMGGTSLHRVAVAVQPHFDSSNPLISTNMFAAAEGLLWHSIDGGRYWQVATQFNTTVSLNGGWSIASLAMSENFYSDRILAVGRLKINAQSGAEEGEIWTNDGSGLFTLRHTLTSGVHSLICSPKGPNGKRTWFAAARSFPNFRAFQDTGILFSVDDGATWQDHDDGQDFSLEDEPGRVTGRAEMGYEQEFVIMPSYANNGEIWYMRQEGIFRFRPGGERWIQLEPIDDRRCRKVDTTFGAQGEKLVYTAGYGMGGVRYNRSLNVVEPLPSRAPMVYGRDLALSPSYAQDGIALFTGNFDLWGWQDPLTALTNPVGTTEWYLPPLLNPAGVRNVELPRFVSMSPHFNGRGVVGDRTWFWITWSGDVRRTEDAGATSKVLGHRATGEAVQAMHSVAVTPTYIASGTRTDVYAGNDYGQIFRLDNELWQLIGDIDEVIMKMEVPSNWSRPANPAMFIMLKAPPYMMQVEDRPSGFVTTSLQRNLNSASPRGFTLHPDFANHPVIFMASGSQGILRLDLSSPSGDWQRIGSAPLQTSHNDVALSADYANDQLVYAATDLGLFEAVDTPNSTWTALTTLWLRDNTQDSITTFSPQDPTNGKPHHAWPWSRIERGSMAGGEEMLGDEVLVAKHDGDFLRTPVQTQRLEVLTYKGPNMGSITVQFLDIQTGAVLASITKDLSFPTNIRMTSVALDNPIPGPSSVRIEAHLSGGKEFYFDGFRFFD
jgi:hypothetical protein